MLPADPGFPPSVGVGVESLDPAPFPAPVFSLLHPADLGFSVLSSGAALLLPLSCDVVIVMVTLNQVVSNSLRNISESKANYCRAEFIYNIRDR